MSSNKKEAKFTIEVIYPDNTDHVADYETELYFHNRISKIMRELTAANSMKIEAFLSRQRRE